MYPYLPIVFIAADIIILLDSVIDLCTLITFLAYATVRKKTSSAHIADPSHIAL